MMLFYSLWLYIGFKIFLIVIFFVVFLNESKEIFVSLKESYMFCFVVLFFLFICLVYKDEFIVF